MFLFIYIYIFKNTIRIIFRTLSIFIPPFFLWIFILIYDYCYPHDIKSDNIIAQNIRIFQESKKERLNRFNFKKKTPSFSLSFSQTIVRDGDIIAHVSLPTLPSLLPSSLNILHHRHESQRTSVQRRGVKEDSNVNALLSPSRKTFVCDFRIAQDTTRDQRNRPRV